MNCAYATLPHFSSGITIREPGKFLNLKTLKSKKSWYYYLFEKSYVW